ncbi:hypothetical protein [Mycoplasma sp. 21DD0573]|uniref:hypothetical protein n=1 Tax=unclassified Mycoplasma TaxID=2683645 RepID=UPI002B1E71E8|nr:hypothetical protein [Mycoplasma sp. 21DD0573]MEA4276386.1 hypothetical protein [Mycoplasma sp. 21DD0573]
MAQVELEVKLDGNCKVCKSPRVQCVCFSCPCLGGKYHVEQMTIVEEVKNEEVLVEETVVEEEQPVEEKETVVYSEVKDEPKEEYVYVESDLTREENIIEPVGGHRCGGHCLANRNANMIKREAEVVYSSSALAKEECGCEQEKQTCCEGECNCEQEKQTCCVGECNCEQVEERVEEAVRVSTEQVVEEVIVKNYYTLHPVANKFREYSEEVITEFKK